MAPIANRLGQLSLSTVSANSWLNCPIPDRFGERASPRSLCSRVRAPWPISYGALDRLAYIEREHFEYWGHALGLPLGSSSISSADRGTDTCRRARCARTIFKP